MDENTVSYNLTKTLDYGAHDALVNGGVKRDIQSRLVLVSSQSELASFTDIEPIGTIAVQYGFKKLWQLKPDKTWEAI